MFYIERSTRQSQALQLKQGFPFSSDIESPSVTEYPGRFNSNWLSRRSPFLTPSPSLPALVAYNPNNEFVPDGKQSQSPVRSGPLYLQPLF